MQVTEKEVKGLTHSYSVTVPAADVERQVEEELQSLGQKVKMPGFRPGKVPMNVLKQKYGKDVMGDVLQNSINKATRDVMEQKKLRPALQPDIKITEYKEGGDLSFDISVDVMPEVKMPDFSKITVDEYTYEIPEKDVEEGLSRLAQSRRHLHRDESGEAKQGSVLKIDFLGKKGGEPFAGGAAQGHFLELGSNQFIPGFEDQLVGAKEGDKREVKVTFPKEYHSADLAGADATFDVTVHEVHRVHAPDVNDKLAEQLGFKDLAALTEAVKGQIGSEYDRAARGKAKKQLFDALDKVAKFDIPVRMVDLEFDSIWKQVEEAKKAGDEELKGKSDEALKKEYRTIAERRVRLGILLSEVGRANNLQIGREELSAAVMEQARNFPGQEDKVFEFYRKNPQQIDELRGPILEEKAVDWVLTQVKRNPKPTTIEALLRDDEDDKKAGKK